jgi:K+-sensing histidine kinase KdpD
MLPDRERIRRIADELGWIVDEAGSVVEMLAALRARPSCDCALIASSLPDGDGFAALTAIKAQSHVPVIVLTGAEGPEVGLRMVAAGAVGCLPKNAFSQESLVQIVQDAVHQASSTGNSAGVPTTATTIEPLPPFHRVMQSACHDLRNPLSAILINANILARSESLLDERRVKTANRIISSVNRMNRIIEDLADYTLATLGKAVSIQPSDTDLAAIVTDVLAETRAAFLGRNIEWQQSGDLRGHWDPGRLRQVLHNLLTNALKSAPPGAGFVVTCKELPASSSVEIRLDTQGQSQGQSVVGQQLLRALESQPTAGSEMFEPGLYIARRIVEAHQGSLVTASSLAETTRFTIRLPKRADPPASL